MYKRHIIGKKGEEVAVKYLEENDYQIIEKNFRCNQGEIDIIAFDKNKKELVFIEVKTRSNCSYGRPSEAVNRNKMRHFINVIKYYIFIKKLQKNTIRIDVIEIYVKNNKYLVNHLKQIV